jgi:DNA replicative helicase MCM subunit Mcm2 (Cdc46/Mcm family)
MGPGTGELDADIAETGKSMSQRERRKGIEIIVMQLAEQHDGGALDAVLEQAEALAEDLFEQAAASRELASKE